MSKTSERERFGKLLAVADTMARTLREALRTLVRIEELVESYQGIIEDAIELHEDTIERWNEEDEDDEDTKPYGLADRVVDEAVEEARLRKAEGR